MEEQYMWTMIGTLVHTPVIQRQNVSFKFMHMYKTCIIYLAVVVGVILEIYKKILKL